MLILLLPYVHLQLPRECNTESIEGIQPSSILQNREEFTLNLGNESDRNNEESSGNSALSLKTYRPSLLSFCINISDNGVIEASQVVGFKRKSSRRKVKHDPKYNDGLILGHRNSPSSGN